MMREKNGQNEFIPVKDWGAAFGYGLFETMRIYNGVPFLLEEHIERLINSSQQLFFLNMPGEEQLKQAVLGYIKEKSLQQEALRLSVTYGNEAEGNPPRVFITHRPVPYGPADYETGIAAAVSLYKKNEFSPIVRHKTFNQMENILSLRLCGEKGVKECIFLNTSGYIAEGSKSNIFFTQAGTVFNPSIECGLLPGITRAKIIELLNRQNIKVKEGRYTLENLYNCDECFCTNSLMEAIPIIKIDGRLAGTGRPGELTRLVLSLYRQCIEKYKIKIKKKFV
jgi:branched-subunit amino acid aminotransferase/4-amino-4-deoxychorismate lyase